MTTEGPVEAHMDTQEDKPKFIFPNLIAKGMANLTTQYQMEASMLSLVIILIGMIIIAVYTIFFLELNLFMNIMIGINAVAGFVFLTSFLVTQYQQYLSFMISQKFKEEFFKE